jgi:hypothetical protein
MLVTVWYAPMVLTVLVGGVVVLSKATLSDTQSRAKGASLQGGTATLLKGRACDPDEPSLSTDVQLSCGGPIGDENAYQLHVIADLPTGDSINEDCGVVRINHRFQATLDDSIKTALNNGDSMVYAYAIDSYGQYSNTSELIFSPMIVDTLV